jgi:hypothetical protein
MAHNLLLIQDDPADAKSVQEALTDSSDETFRLEWVRSCSAGIERLNATGKAESDGIAGYSSTCSCPTARGSQPSIGCFALHPTFRSWSSLPHSIGTSPNWQSSMEDW